jgi:hypothetical protein
MKIGQEFVATRKFAVHTEKSSKNDQVTTFVCTDKEHRELVKDVRSCLSDELRKPDYRGNSNQVAGHCYVVSEVIYHKLGGKSAGWTPQTIQHEGGPHWYLQHKDGTIVDATADQFESAVPYTNGRGCGFLTHQPSARSKTLIGRLDQLG